ncbi:MAG TPA: hypothetical protein VGC41_06265 [Kofleriaceae bacterium]
MRAVILWGLVACGGHPDAARRPAPITPDAPPIAEPAPKPGPNDAECDALIDHAIDLQAKDLQSEQRTKLHGELHDKAITRCRAMPRASFDCAMAATTNDAFTACE